MRIRVSLSSRAAGGRRRIYHARWFDPITGKQRGVNVGSDKFLGRQRAAEIERQLNAGEWHEVRDVTWCEFVADHVAKLRTKSKEDGDGDTLTANQSEAKRILEDFGATCSPTCPKQVTFGMLERYRAALLERGLSAASVNKHFRYVRAALRAAKRRKHAGDSAFDSTLFVPENHAEPRVVSYNEEDRLHAGIQTLYGKEDGTLTGRGRQWQAFVTVAIETAARRGELLSLTWCRVDLDGASVLFTRTKGRKDRRVPITDETVSTLAALQAMTQQDGGPFIALRDNAGRDWDRIREAAALSDVSIHDLRRTALTRMATSGTPMHVLQRLAGHAAITTTNTFYLGLGSDDLRRAVNSASLARNLHKTGATERQAKKA